MKQLNIFSKFFLFVCLFIYFSNNLEAQITIDGNFSDWSSSYQFMTDADNDYGSGDYDLTAGYYTYNSNTLFVRFDVKGSINPDGANGKFYIIYFDTDQNTTTGFTAGWWTMGADYRVVIWDNSTFYLQNFMGSNNSDDSWGWGGTLWNTYPISAAYSGSSCEFAVAFSDIGSPSSMWFQFRADSSGADGMPAFNESPRDNSPLPVQLSFFTARVNKDNNVELLWNTVSEVNNFGFEIEKKSNNGNKSVHWESIGFVKGNGISNKPVNYIFIDKNPGYGELVYRLKQIDIDGSFSYSNEVKVNVDVPKVFELRQNYPNPFNPQTTISFTLSKDGLTKLTVYDLLGREIKTLINDNLKAGELYTVKFDGSDLPSGIYLYKLESDDNVLVKKFILMK